MSRKIFAGLMAVMMGAMAMAAPVKNMPVKRVQPKGDTLYCWVSGDEFFHRLHDAQDYTIMLNPETGWYVYATTEEGKLIPTQWVPGVDDPAQHGLVPGLRPDAKTLREMHRAWEVPSQYQKAAPKTSGANHGTLNNIVIFIHFSDETTCTTDSFSTINAMFNDSTTGNTSMYDYFKRTSYNKLHIITHYYPTPSGNTVLSYQDTFPRSYYQPYSLSNPNGYLDDNASRNREFSLLQRAVAWVNANSPIPSTLNIDMDNDGYVDNICFVASGTYTGWSDLLWPHKWSLYDRDVYINGKQVYTFNFQLAGSGSHYFSTSVFCHEMTHTLGAPDLYHYYYYDDVSAAGSWDLMHANTTPPQQTNSLFKLKYMNWFDSIPQLTTPGRYTMSSLATGANHAYKIASSNNHQWYILEYRNTTDTFDSSIPNRGMLIWRYNNLNTADNMEFDNSNTPHELWLFRPNSTNDTTNGTISSAAFGVNGRNQFDSSSNPHPYLCNGTADTSFSITNIAISNDFSSVSFTFNPNGGGGGSTCDTIRTFPHTQDFETGDLDCWTFVSNNTNNALDAGTNSARIYESSHTSHNGNYCFRFSSYSSAEDYNQYLISPRIESQLPMHLTFYYKKHNYYTETFSVKYSTTTNAPAAFTNTLTTITVTSSSNYALCDLLVPANAHYIAINYNSEYKYYLYVDDITLRDTLGYRISVNCTGSGSGQTVLADSSNADLCGQTWEAVADGEISLKFLPSQGSHLAHLYVNDVDRISEVQPYDNYATWSLSPTGNITINPVFVIDTFTVSITSNDTTRGLVSGSGVYEYLSTATATATPYSGYHFVGWNDGNTEPSRSIVVVSDTTLSATFEPIESINNMTQDNYQVLGSTQCIIVRHAVQHEVRIYDVSGRQVAHIDKASDEQKFVIRYRGLYLVVIDDTPACKVMVK